MAGVAGRAAGFIATLYSYTKDSTKSVSTVEAALITANEIIDVSDMGTLSKDRAIIDIPVYGEDVAGKLPGQADPGTFDFTVTLNLDDTKHKAIRDDAGTTELTYVVEYTQGAKKTYAVFDGYIGNASVTQAIDGAITMECSVARSGGLTWLDKA